MNLSNCRDLKSQVLSRAARCGTQHATRQAFRARRARVKRAQEVRVDEPTPVAAVGVAPAGGKDYRLAVRIFRGQERHSDTLMRGLGRHEGEIDLVTGVRYRPRITVRPGGSCGHFRITAGTLGGFVEDDDSYYLLSNNHVLANSNCCFESDPILQPGPSDVTGSGFDVIGRLHRWYPLSRQQTAGVDAALARFDDSVDFFVPWTYTGVGTIKKTPVANRFSVSRVIKRGRTTNVTRGTVSAFELDGVAIDYGTPGAPAVVTFDDQIEVIGSPPSRPFSQPGDSGSFIIDRDTMQVFALLYAGGPDSQGIDRTLAHFMPDVFREMKVRLVQ